MVRCELSVIIDSPAKPVTDERWMQTVVDTTLNIAAMEEPVELSLVITGDETMRRLNREYRGIDDTTDVLSFAMQDKCDRDASIPFVDPDDDITHLGEVLISYPQAQIQAEEHGHPLKRELALLITHGVLHLLGHDHGDRASAAKMRAAEKKVLEELSDGNIL